MKKIFFIGWLLSFPYLFANPVVIPRAVISELFFDEKGDWTLEISYGFGEHVHSDVFDSICVSSSQGYSKIKNDIFMENDSFFVVRSDDLIRPVSLDRHGDRISIYSYPKDFSWLSLVDSLAFGDYPGSMFDSLRSGYSICSLGLGYDLFCKDKSPTIGQTNDTSGTCGTLRGFIYDYKDDLIRQGSFILEYPIVFLQDGSYSTRVLARRTDILDIGSITATQTYSYVGIDTVHIDMEPDSVLTRDIHVLFDNLDGVEERSSGMNLELEVINYPNPFNSSTNFFIQLPPRVKNTRCVIQIFNVRGQEIKSMELTDNPVVQWDGKDRNGFLQPSGVYHYRLVVGDRSYKTGSLVFLK